MRGAENMDSYLKEKDNGSLASELDESSVLFGTVSAEITQETADFFVSDMEGDPDCPSEGFSSIDQAIDALRQGKVRFKIIITVMFFLCHIKVILIFS